MLRGEPRRWLQGTDTARVGQRLCVKPTESDDQCGAEIRISEQSDEEVGARRAHLLDKPFERSRARHRRLEVRSHSVRGRHHFIDVGEIERHTTEVALMIQIGDLNLESDREADFASCQRQVRSTLDVLAAWYRKPDVAQRCLDLPLGPWACEAEGRFRATGIALAGCEVR